MLKVIYEKGNNTKTHLDYENALQLSLNLQFLEV